ncbi:MAG: hypothetical protein H8M99_03740 [Gloeobacteraceae cyanobacterium ES-bin-144]|nr:hypothetical protein [Verrucomicrobiales bacterium]
MKLVLALAALTMIAHAAASVSDPGETAVKFLEKVRTKSVNLEPGGDTAISPQTTEPKRNEIALRLERMARDIGEDSLEVAAIKLDNDIAAVLIRKTSGFDLKRAKIFPVALVKRNGAWTPAPVPASFENSGVGYDPELRKRLEYLKDWMLREQIADMENFREQSPQRMRHKLEEAVPITQFRKFSAQQAIDRFLSACEQRKLPEMLALLGGLSNPLPDDWQQRLEAAENAVADATQSNRPWRSLTALEVLRIPLMLDEDQSEGTAFASMAYLDPARNNGRPNNAGFELLDLDLSKSRDGLWQINPPATFWDNSVSQDADANDNPDIDLLDLIPAKLALKYPTMPEPTAVLAKNALMEILRNKLPSSWVPRVNIDGEPTQVRNRLTQAAKIWWDTSNPSATRLTVPLDFHENGDYATAACQFFDTRNLDIPNLMFLYFTKTPMGWLWEPIPSDDAKKKLSEWTDQQSKEWPKHWQPKVLADCHTLEKIPDAAPPSAEESRKCVESFHQAIRSGDITAAIRLTARLKTPDSATNLLRNLGYEMTGVLQNKQTSTIIDIYQGKFWTAVGSRIDSKGKTTFPLYPLLVTPQGPRILLEINLAASDNRSRDFLNKTMMERLRKINAPAAGDLDKLYSEHKSRSSLTAKP